MTAFTFEEITKKKPEKSLVEPLRSKAGRNNQGRLTTRHRGGGEKRAYRIIDFKRDLGGGPDHGPRRRDGATAPALGRGAAGQRPLLRHGWASRQRRARKHQSRQGWSEAAHGLAADRARLGDDAARPSPRRRRGKGPNW